MAIKIGTISISLSAETASFQTGMEKASQIALNSSKNIERSFSMMAAAVATATGAAIGSLSLLIDKTENVVFSMQKMAQQAGVSIEKFSQLAYAAKVAGMPVDQMAVILTRISHSSYEAASGSKQAAAAYKALGVDVYDAHQHFKTADQLVLELAQKLDQYRDSAAKTGIETMIMGRSGAQAAEFMSVLANRFDEISSKAERLGVVFNMGTAVQAQKLHDSFVALEEAGLGLSVRLLSAVSPALDRLADKIVAFVSDAENMKKIDEIGTDIAHGIEAAAHAIEFLVEHADALKSILEVYAGMRIGGFLLPMISSASAASGVLGKLGIAVGNISGKLLGLGKLGTNLAPLASNATGYAQAIGELASEEGVGAAATLALSDAAAVAGASLKSLALTVGPIAALTAALYEFYGAYTSYTDLKEMEKQSGASYWEIERAEIKQTFTSLTALKNLFESIVSDKAQFEYREQALASIGKSSIIGTPKAPGLPEGYNPFNGTMDKAHSGNVQKELKGLEGVSKIDQLKQKLEELANRAKEAEHAFASVGLDPDVARKLEIQDRVNQFMIEQTKNLQGLSEKRKQEARAEAEASITTEVTLKAATKYKEALLGVTQSVHETTAEHLAMAAAVGRSAQAMQEAAIAAKVNQEMTKAGGPSWAKNPKMAADAQKLANDLRADMNATNAEADAKSISALQLQIDAQQKLNNAIMQGADARRQAALESEIAQARQEFTDRGDTDNAALERQIALLRRKAQLEHDQEALGRAAAMNPAYQYQEQERALRDAVATAARYGKAIDFTAVLAADYDAWKQFGDAQRDAMLKTGSAADGLRAALSKLADDTQSNAKMMYDALNNVVSQLNDAIAKTAMMNNHQPHAVRNAFSGAFRNIGDTLMKSTLQKAEGTALQKLGLGTPGKPDGSQGKPFWVKFAQQAAKAPNELDQLGAGGGNSDSGDDLSSATVTKGGLLGTIANKGMGWLAKLLKGIGGGSGGDGGGDVNYVDGFADGGDFPGGVPMVVGERGPELMIPSASGTVVPNSQMKNFGGGHTFNIDASNSHDPAATVAAIHNYMQQAAPKLIEKSVMAVQDTQRRVPRSKM